MAIPEFRTSLQGVPYEETVAAKTPRKGATTSYTPQSGSPIGVTVYDQVTLQSSNAEGYNDSRKGQNATSEKKSNSLLGATSLSARESQTSFNTDHQPPSSLTSAPSIPQIRIEDESEQTTPRAEENSLKWLSIKPMRQRPSSQKKNTNNVSRAFQGIDLDLPSGSLGDELQTTKMQFSNRGSMFLDGRKVSPSESVPERALQRPAAATKRIPTSSSMPDRMPTRILSTDEEMLSEKVRLFYAQGSDAVIEADQQSDIANKIRSSWINQLGPEVENGLNTSQAPSTTDLSIHQSPTISSLKTDHFHREEMELAGGLEDWQNIDSADVDRFGFIIPKSPSIGDNASGINRSPTVRGQGLQRVSTSLQVAAETPRRKRTVRRSSGDFQQRSVSDTLTRTTSNHSIPRPSSSKSATMHKQSALRAASNRLPGHRDRRLMDEAGDMFTLPRSLTAGPITRTATAESDRSAKSQANVETKASSVAARKKENEREEKWRKMARPINSSPKKSDHKEIGGGMLFSFPPTTDAKLIARTWKGIPDTWRAPAWHYFLTVSARKNPHSIPDEKLVKLFYEYQDINSPDDVQIDIDVPRTISSHIMFRRRYRGGQRLLFRVLHAMSVHWPETGYVQGMAALAATLLSYYEEEKAFVMLVRLWECRGLGKLYKEGFGGLMEALDDFEHNWLGEGEVAKQLNDLNIVPTAYGTKWYLTLFNYSIPFAAQLRVWDVFMLLGDNTDSASSATQPSTPLPPSQSSSSSPEDAPFGTILDILHATSAALIDGMRDILLESDFENAMKVLTSWIPIRDEDLFMRVARAEWKVHLGRKKKVRS